MPTNPIQLNLDLGSDVQKARRHWKANPDQLLGDFLSTYHASAPQQLSPDYFSQPLKNFQLIVVEIEPGRGFVVSPSNEVRARGLRSTLDNFYEADKNPRKLEPGRYPEDISAGDAVKTAYQHELSKAADYLKNGLSVLVICDKMLTEHIYEYVCKLAGKIPCRDDTVPADAPQPSGRQALDRAMQGQSSRSAQDNLPLLIRGLKDHEVLVLRSIDLLDAPPLIEVLYQNTGGGKQPQLLGFLDPSLDVKKVLTDRFAIRVGIMGLSRYIQPDHQNPPEYTVVHLITAKERQCFGRNEFDPEGLYKNVSGLNALQFRNAMRYVGATVAENSPSRKIYDEIRNFKTSSSNEIEIPDISFDDIGGYEQIKRELQRIVELATGRVPGLDEKERQRLVPRGFIFHGPPGTGKTLFAKAIANEMHATIQMVSGPEIMDKYVGQSESNLRHIFATARRNAPSVIFFDEFDSLASQRSTYSDGGSRANNAVVAQLLTELDGFREDQSVMVIGTTNRLDIIDEALLRPSRLKPVEIGLPDVRARRKVAAIHAEKFGVDILIRDLIQLVLENLDGWKGDELPSAFLEMLFQKHPGYRLRYEAQGQQAGFLRDLIGFFELVKGARSPEAVDGQAEESLLVSLEDRLRRLAPKYGLDPDSLAAQGDPAGRLEIMQNDLQDLFQLVKGQEGKESEFSPNLLVQSTLDLVAEYTDNFNNDEIRAIFQEASLEHHLEGQLITPRYLGLKIGLLRKRRDERQVVHLSPQRGRR
jgi:transitional endoplasmic reticulum ATPase